MQIQRGGATMKNRSESEPRILMREIITNQSDPRMIEFRESQGEFKPGCNRKTIRLEITEYAPDGANPMVTTKFGYYEGEPPPEYRQLIRDLLYGLMEGLDDV
jgi:hypothetical protein